MFIKNILIYFILLVISFIFPYYAHAATYYVLLGRDSPYPHNVHADGSATAIYKIDSNFDVDLISINDYSNYYIDLIDFDKQDYIINNIGNKFVNCRSYIINDADKNYIENFIKSADNIFKNNSGLKYANNDDDFWWDIKTIIKVDNNKVMAFEYWKARYSIEANIKLNKEDVQMLESINEAIFQLRENIYFSDTSKSKLGDPEDQVITELTTLFRNVIDMYEDEYIIDRQFTDVACFYAMLMLTQQKILPDVFLNPSLRNCLGNIVSYSFSRDREYILYFYFDDKPGMYLQAVGKAGYGFINSCGHDMNDACRDHLRSIKLMYLYGTHDKIIELDRLISPDIYYNDTGELAAELNSFKKKINKEKYGITFDE